MRKKSQKFTRKKVMNEEENNQIYEIKSKTFTRKQS